MFLVRCKKVVKMLQCSEFFADMHNSVMWQRTKNWKFLLLRKHMRKKCKMLLENFAQRFRLCIGSILIQASLCSSIHSLRIRMTSYPCHKYEQITRSSLSSVKYHIQTETGSNYLLIERQRNVCQLRLLSLNYCARWTSLALEIINSYY